VIVAGRMMLKRVMGKASFATLQDGSARIQLFISKENIKSDDAETIYENFKHWDLGDILGATGVLFKTKTGELSIRVSHLRLLTKSIRPLPEKFHGLADQEVKYRQRYVDLIMSDETKHPCFILFQVVLQRNLLSLITTHSTCKCICVSRQNFI
jgi:lysyl-tRNA synthetase class 2